MLSTNFDWSGRVDTFSLTLFRGTWNFFHVGREKKNSSATTINFRNISRHCRRQCFFGVDVDVYAERTKAVYKGAKSQEL